MYKIIIYISKWSGQTFKGQTSFDSKYKQESFWKAKRLCVRKKKKKHILCENNHAFLGKKKDTQLIGTTYEHDEGPKILA